MMILKVLQTAGPEGQHGYGIARRIHQISQDALQIEEGSLYPALHRLARRRDVVSRWGESESNRRARYYAITDVGRKRLKSEAAAWNRVSSAVGQVMGSHQTIHVASPLQG